MRSYHRPAGRKRPYPPGPAVRASLVAFSNKGHGKEPLARKAADAGLILHTLVEQFRARHPKELAAAEAEVGLHDPDRPRRRRKQ